jgi:hypothetical protein
MSLLVDLLYAMPAANAVTPMDTASDPTRMDDHGDIDVLSHCDVDMLFPHHMMYPDFLALRNLLVGATNLVIREAILTNFNSPYLCLH